MWRGGQGFSEEKDVNNLLTDNPRSLLRRSGPSPSFSSFFSSFFFFSFFSSFSAVMKSIIHLAVASEVILRGVASAAGTSCCVGGE
jgi:hypothetical protein